MKEWRVIWEDCIDRDFREGGREAGRENVERERHSHKDKWYYFNITGLA